MHHRKLGTTGCLTGEIGLDAAALAAAVADDDAVVAMVRHAVDHGAGLIDANPFDGNGGKADDGRPERLVARGIEGRREQALVATRAGLMNRGGALIPAFGAEPIARSARESLERLRCEYIDLFQLHEPTLDDLRDDALWDALLRLKSDGVIRHIGITTSDLAVALPALADHRIETLQISLNAADTSMLAVLPRAQAAGVGLIVRSPLLPGISSDEGSSPEHAAAATSPDAALSSASLADRVSRWLRQGSGTPAQAALGWVLAHDAVSTVITPARTMAQLEEHIAASYLPLPSPRQLLAIQHLHLTNAAP